MARVALPARAGLRMLFQLEHGAREGAPPGAPEHVPSQSSSIRTTRACDLRVDRMGQMGPLVLVFPGRHGCAYGPLASTPGWHCLLKHGLGIRRLLGLRKPASDLASSVGRRVNAEHACVRPETVPHLQRWCRLLYSPEDSDKRQTQRLTESPCSLLFTLKCHVSRPCSQTTLLRHWDATGR